MNELGSAVAIEEGDHHGQFELFKDNISWMKQDFRKGIPKVFTLEHVERKLSGK